MNDSLPLPSDARRALALYNLVFPFVFLLLLPGFLLRMFRRGNFKDRFGQRLSLYRKEDRARLGAHPWIWIRSISVGETLIALKLARQMRQADPTAQILLSVTTTTGLALAQENASDWLEPIYNPIDLLPIVRRALALLRPSQIILIENEAWPNLLAECHRRGIPVSIASARLSPRSERGFRRHLWITGPVFRLLTRIAVPDPIDVARWQSLGVAQERLQCTGSIKFDFAAPFISRVDEFRRLAESLGLRPETPTLVAGSTFDGEEKLLAELLLKLRADFPDLVLILTPRHVERTAAILRELEPLGLRVIRRSSLASASTAAAPARPACEILLIDTTGELRDWYALATVVFVGKSLTAIGGQNPAEPAMLGKPVLFGPHMENFEALVAHLLAHQAARQVRDADELTAAVRELLSHPDQRAAFGVHARAALSAHQGATARTVDLFAHLMAAKPPA